MEKRKLYARNTLWKFLTGAIFKNKFLMIEMGPSKMEVYEASKVKFTSIFYVLAK